MLMVHIMLSEFFPLEDSNVDALAASLAGIASESRGKAPGFALSHQGVAIHPDTAGTLFLDFTPRDLESPLQVLQGRIRGLVDDFADSTEVLPQTGCEFRIFLPLMQYAGLSPNLFSDALEFATTVVDDLEVPGTTTAWRLLLARFQSQAAGENWVQGGWVNDVSWDLVASYPL
ncbi:MAG: hypothetical protein BZY88_04830 [SAR202 cluster bacterium Io17-Chloro-G9]|nr:MAG: hypothetical protein BZY88_04830 [SAR202 cluster bacterium Io17-Chloro-G9]